MRFLAAAFLVAAIACTAEAHEAPKPQYVMGPPQPIFRTPVRTAVWQWRQPRAYYRPIYPAQPQGFCPHCQRP